VASPRCRAAALAAALTGQQVKFRLGPFGPGPRLGPGFIERLGAGFQDGAELVTLAGGIGAGPFELGSVCCGGRGEAVGGSVAFALGVGPAPVRTRASKRDSRRSSRT
jgi:hypothetical protein